MSGRGSQSGGTFLGALLLQRVGSEQGFGEDIERDRKEGGDKMNDPVTRLA